MKSKCKCGAVEIVVNTDEHNSINCHCNMCRENHGSAFTTWISVAAGKVSIPSESSIQEYPISENSSTFFCAKCGTKVYAKDKRYSDVIAFLAGTVFDVTLKKPSGDYFYSDKAPWYTAENDIPKFGGLSGFEKLENT